jgi:hypothetical protein
MNGPNELELMIGRLVMYALQSDDLTVRNTAKYFNVKWDNGEPFVDTFPPCPACGRRD